MKKFFLTPFVLLAAMLLLPVAPASAQHAAKTFVLARHAEKAETDADATDPPLSPAGTARAERLAKLVGKYRVGAVYSSDFKRTRATAEAAAKARRLTVKLYDPKDPQALIDEILKSKIKRILIIGHTNSIPKLANLILKKDLFKNLEEAEYGTVYVIRLHGGRPPRAEIIAY